MNPALVRHLAREVPEAIAQRVGGDLENAAVMFLGELGEVLKPAAIDKLQRNTVLQLFEDWLFNYAALARSQRIGAIMAGMQLAPISFTLFASGHLLSEPDRPEPRDNVVQLHARIR